MRSAGVAFDAGATDEALRLPVDLRLLLLYGRGQPLLHQPGLIKKMAFTDTGPNPPPGARSLGSSGGLVVFKMTIIPAADACAGIVAPLGNGPPDRYANPARRYPQWWRQDRPIVGNDDQRYSREFVVIQMANTEGAHVDAYLDGDYEALRRDTLGWTFSDGNGPDRPIDGNVVTASIRQVAYEVIDTLEREVPSLVT
jgi:hypothetical protein